MGNPIFKIGQIVTVVKKIECDLWVPSMDVAVNNGKDYKIKNISKAFIIDCGMPVYHLTLSAFGYWFPESALELYIQPLKDYSNSKYLLWDRQWN